MGSQDLKHEQIESAARRIAAAFQVTQWTMVAFAGAHRFYGQGPDERFISLLWEEGLPTSISVGFESTKRGHLKPEGLCKWNKYGLIESEQSESCDLIVYGLYRLGLGDLLGVEHLLNLSAHEKMELRLSLPRELWPKKWLEEEAAQSVVMETHEPQ